MLLEAISLSFNLGIFSCLLWSIFSFENIRLVDKLKKIPFFVIFGSFFYSVFHLSSLFQIRIFELKSIYFNGCTIIILCCLLGLILFVSKRSLKFYASILSIIFSPYFFFLLFGLEEFSCGEYKISSYSLLKTQNPMIGLTSLFLLFIKPYKIQIPAFLLLTGFLFYHINPLKEFPFPEIKILHFKYIPHEFFLKENSYLFEENSGIYTEKKQDADDILYKFTMKPIKKIKHPLKRTLQHLISTFEFPIILIEGNRITLLDLSRSYNHSIFKIIFETNNESNEIEVIGAKGGLDTTTIKIEGPLF